MPAAHPEEIRRDVVRVARKGEVPLSQIAKDFGGQLVSRLLGEPLATRDSSMDVPELAGPGIAARGDPHLPPVRP